VFVVTATIVLAIAKSLSRFPSERWPVEPVVQALEFATAILALPYLTGGIPRLARAIGIHTTPDPESTEPPGA